MLVRDTIRVRCVQHPSGQTWITAVGFVPHHWEVLAEQQITVQFDVDAGYRSTRTYPDGLFVSRAALHDESDESRASFYDALYEDAAAEDPDIDDLDDEEEDEEFDVAQYVPRDVDDDDEEGDEDD